MAEKKKYDSDIVGWFTRGGKRHPIRKSETKKGKKPENAKKEGRADSLVLNENIESNSPKDTRTGQEATRERFERIERNNERKEKAIEKDYERVDPDDVNEGDTVYIRSGGKRPYGIDSIRMDRRKSAGGNRFYGEDYGTYENSNLYKKKDSGIREKRNRYDKFLKEHNATDYDVNEALDYMYGTDRKLDFMDYTDDEVKRAIDYHWKNSEPNPYENWTPKSKKNKRASEEAKSKAFAETQIAPDMEHIREKALKRKKGRINGEFRSAKEAIKACDDPNTRWGKMVANGDEVLLYKNKTTGRYRLSDKPIKDKAWEEVDPY